MPRVIILSMAWVWDKQPALFQSFQRWHRELPNAELILDLADELVVVQRQALESQIIGVFVWETAGEQAVGQPFQ